MTKMSFFNPKWRSPSEKRHQKMREGGAGIVKKIDGVWKTVDDQNKKKKR
jgi:hypothetical protein